MLEEKGAAIALHYRLADADIAQHLRRQLDELVTLHGNGGLVLQPGACVFEIKPAGVTKANAIEAFLAEPPFAGRTALVCWRRPDRPAWLRGRGTPRWSVDRSRARA